MTKGHSMKKIIIVFSLACSPVFGMKQEQQCPEQQRRGRGLKRTQRYDNIHAMGSAEGKELLIKKAALVTREKIQKDLPQPKENNQQK